MLTLRRRIGALAPSAQTFVAAGSVLVLIYFLYIWRLGSLTPGLSPQEYLARQNSESLAQIFTQGVNMPYYLLQHLLTKLPFNEPSNLRLASVIFALMAFIGLLSLLRGWFGRYSAGLVSLIFISTPWVVLTSRTAAPNIIFFWPIVLVAFYSWLKRGQWRSEWLFVVFCLVCGLSLYTPGLIWLCLATGLIMRASLTNATKEISRRYIVVGIVSALLLLAPLVAAIVAQPDNLRTLLLIPAKWGSLLEILKSVGWSGLALFWATRNHLDIGLGRLPLFDIFQIALSLFGVYAIAVRNRRFTILLGALLLFAILTAGLNHNQNLINLAFLSIAIYMAAGLRYLYLEWRQVFPFNPFSYGLAISLILIVTVVHLFYGIRYSLLAWPHAPETQDTYVLK